MVICCGSTRKLIQCDNYKVSHLIGGKERIQVKETDSRANAINHTEVQLQNHIHYFILFLSHSIR